MNEPSEEYRDYILKKRFEEVFRKYAPKGREGEFHADLAMLVQAVHADAIRPYQKTMDGIIKAFPPFHITAKL